MAQVVPDPAPQRVQRLPEGFILDGLNVERQGPANYPFPLAMLNIPEKYRKQRLIGLLSCLLYAIVVPILIVSLRLEWVDIQLQPSAAVHLTTQGCDVVLRQTSDTLAAPVLHIRQGRTLLSAENSWAFALASSGRLNGFLDTDQRVVTGNNVTVIEGALGAPECVATLDLPGPTHAVDVFIHGHGTAVITVQSSGLLRLPGKRLSLDAGFASLKLARGLLADHLDVLIRERGQVVVSPITADAHISIAPDYDDCVYSAAIDRCVGRGGDIFLSVNAHAAVQVDAHQSNGVICLTGARVAKLFSSNTTCATTNSTMLNNTSAGLPAQALPAGIQCDMSSLLFADNSTTSYTPAFTLTLSAGHGGVYVSTAVPSKEAVALMQAADGGAFHAAPGLSAASTIELQGVAPWLWSDPNTDGFVRINLSQQPGNLLWAFATRLVFLQMEPRWFAALSGGLLSPRVKEIQARLLPGFCPASAMAAALTADAAQSAANPLEQLPVQYTLQQLMLTTISTPAVVTNSDAAQLFVVASKMNEDGFQQVARTSLGDYYLVPIHLADNIALCVAVGLSLFIATCFCFKVPSVLNTATTQATDAFAAMANSQDKLCMLAEAQSMHAATLAANDDDITAVNPRSVFRLGGRLTVADAWALRQCFYYAASYFACAYAVEQALSSFMLFAYEQTAPKLRPSWYLFHDLDARIHNPDDPEVTFEQLMEHYERFCTAAFLKVERTDAILDYLQNRRTFRNDVQVKSVITDILRHVRPRDPRKDPEIGELSLSAFRNNVTLLCLAQHYVITTSRTDYVPLFKFEAQLAITAKSVGEPHWAFEPSHLQGSGVQFVEHTPVTLLSGMRYRPKPFDLLKGEEFLLFRALVCGVHIVLAVLPVLPLLFFVLWLQGIYNDTTASYDAPVYLRPDDLWWRPWNVLVRAVQPGASEAFVWLAVAICILNVVELIAFYRWPPSFGFLQLFQRLLDDRRIGSDVTVQQLLKYLKKNQSTLFPGILRFTPVLSKHSDKQDDKIFRLAATEFHLYCRSFDELLQAMSHASPQQDAGLFLFSQAGPLHQWRLSHSTGKFKDKAFIALRATCASAAAFFLRVLVSLCIAYVGLVGLWWLLGSVLNPTRFLPMAAAAATFATAMTVKARKVWQLRKTGMDSALQIAKNKIGTVVKSSPLATELTQQASRLQSMLERAAVRGTAAIPLASLASRPIRDMLTKVEAATSQLRSNPAQLLRIARGDPDSVRQFALTSLGIDPNAGRLLVAFARNNKPELVAAIRELIAALSAVTSETAKRDSVSTTLVLNLVDIIAADTDAARRKSYGTLILNVAYAAELTDLQRQLLLVLVQAISSKEEQLLLQLAKAILEQLVLSAPSSPLGQFGALVLGFLHRSDGTSQAWTPQAFALVNQLMRPVAPQLSSSLTTMLDHILNGTDSGASTSVAGSKYLREIYHAVSSGQFEQALEGFGKPFDTDTTAFSALLRVVGGRHTSRGNFAKSSIDFSPELGSMLRGLLALERNSLALRSKGLTAQALQAKTTLVAQLLEAVGASSVQVRAIRNLLTAIFGGGAYGLPESFFNDLLAPHLVDGAGFLREASIVVNLLGCCMNSRCGARVVAAYETERGSVPGLSEFRDCVHRSQSLDSAVIRGLMSKLHIIPQHEGTLVDVVCLVTQLSLVYKRGLYQSPQLAQQSMSQAFQDVHRTFAAVAAFLQIPSSKVHMLELAFQLAFSVMPTAQLDQMLPWISGAALLTPDQAASAQQLLREASCFASSTSVIQDMLKLAQVGVTASSASKHNIADLADSFLCILSQFQAQTDDIVPALMALHDLLASVHALVPPQGQHWKTKLRQLQLLVKLLISVLQLNGHTAREALSDVDWPLPAQDLPVAEITEAVLRDSSILVDALRLIAAHQQRGDTDQNQVERLAARFAAKCLLLVPGNAKKPVVVLCVWAMMSKFSGLVREDVLHKLVEEEVQKLQPTPAHVVREHTSHWSIPTALSAANLKVTNLQQFNPLCAAPYMQLVASTYDQNIRRRSAALEELLPQLGMPNPKVLLAALTGDSAFMSHVTALAHSWHIPAGAAVGLVGLATGSQPYLQDGAAHLADKLGFKTAPVLPGLIGLIRHTATEATIQPLASALQLPAALLLTLGGSTDPASYIAGLRCDNSWVLTSLGLRPELHPLAELLVRIPFSHVDRYQTVQAYWGDDSFLPLLCRLSDLTRADDWESWLNQLHTALLEWRQLLSQAATSSTAAQSSQGSLSRRVVAAACKRFPLEPAIVEQKLQALLSSVGSQQQTSHTDVQEIKATDDDDSQFQPGADDQSLLALVELALGLPVGPAALLSAFRSGSGVSNAHAAQRRYALVSLLANSVYHEASDAVYADGGVMYAALANWTTSASLLSAGPHLIAHLLSEADSSLSVSFAEASALWMLICIAKPGFKLVWPSMSCFKLLLPSCTQADIAVSVQAIGHLNREGAARMFAAPRDEELVRLADQLQVTPQALGVLFGAAFACTAAIRKLASPEFLSLPVPVISYFLVAQKSYLQESADGSQPSFAELSSLLPEHVRILHSLQGASNGTNVEGLLAFGRSMFAQRDSQQSPLVDTSGSETSPVSLSPSQELFQALCAISLGPQSGQAPSNDAQLRDSFRLLCTEIAGALVPESASLFEFMYGFYLLCHHDPTGLRYLASHACSRLPEKLRSEAAVVFAEAALTLVTQANVNETRLHSAAALSERLHDFIISLNVPQTSMAQELLSLACGRAHHLSAAVLERCVNALELPDSLLLFARLLLVGHVFSKQTSDLSNDCKSVHAELSMLQDHEVCVRLLSECAQAIASHASPNSQLLPPKVCDFLARIVADLSMISSSQPGKLPVWDCWCTPLPLDSPAISWRLLEELWVVIRRHLVRPPGSANASEMWTDLLHISDRSLPHHCQSLQFRELPRQFGAQDPSTETLCQSLLALLSGDSTALDALLPPSLKPFVHHLRTAFGSFRTGDRSQTLASVLQLVLDSLAAAQQVDSSPKLHALLEFVRDCVMVFDSCRSIEVQQRRLRNHLCTSIQRVASVLIPDEPKLVTLISGICHLYAGNVDGLRPLMEHFGHFDGEKLEQVIDWVQSTQFSRDVLDTDTKSVGPKTAEPTDDPRELFARFDTDRSGSLDFAEFWQMMRAMNLNLSAEAARKIFTEADADESKRLSVREFEVALALLQKEVAHRALTSVKLSSAAVTRELVWLAIMLVFILAFVLVGVAGMTTGTSFGAVINSVLSVAAGGALTTGQRSDASSDQSNQSSDQKQKYEAAVDGAMQSMQPQTASE